MSDAIRTVLARVKELDGNASSGPWKKTQEWLSHPRGFDIIAPGGVTVADECCGYRGSIHTAEDADLITEYRTAAPRLALALEAVLEVHRAVEIEPSETICHGCSTLRGTGVNARYFPYEEWPCDTVQALTEHLGGD